MQLSHKIISVLPHRIKCRGKHLFWSTSPDESLADSINELGQVSPVFVQQSGDELELIAGYARTVTLQKMNRNVLVRLVTDADEQDKGLLYLTDNAARIPDDGMRLSALLYFSAFLKGNELKSTLFPRLGVKPKSKDAKWLLGWLKLPDIWQAHLKSGNIPLATGPVLARMSDDDRKAIEPLFGELSWSRSNAVNMLNWLFEISKMQSVPIQAIMESTGLNTILKQGFSPKDAIARLTTTAKNARYPQLSNLQESFAKTARELTVGTKWRMTQPNNFETSGSELSIHIKDDTQLRQAADDLTAMSKRPQWEEIWKLGSQDD